MLHHAYICSLYRTLNTIQYFSKHAHWQRIALSCRITTDVCISWTRKCFTEAFSSKTSALKLGDATTFLKLLYSSFQNNETKDSNFFGHTSSSAHVWLFELFQLLVRWIWRQVMFSWVRKQHLLPNISGRNGDLQNFQLSLRICRLELIYGERVTVFYLKCPVVMPCWFLRDFSPWHTSREEGSWN